jgi:hypothetical protein
MYVYCNAPEIWVFVTSHTRRSGQCIVTSCKHSDIGTPQKKEFYLCANTPVAARAWVATLRWANCSFLLLREEVEASNNCELLDCYRCTHIISRYFTWIHMTFGQVLFFQESVLNSKVPSATSNLYAWSYWLLEGSSFGLESPRSSFQFIKWHWACQAWDHGCPGCCCKHHSSLKFPAASPSTPQAAGSMDNVGILKVWLTPLLNSVQMYFWWSGSVLIVQTICTLNEAFDVNHAASGCVLIRKL